MICPCRIPGCTGTDTSVLRLCDRHFLMLPPKDRAYIRQASRNTWAFREELRNAIMAPLIHKAVDYVLATENAPSLFGVEK